MVADGFCVLVGARIGISVSVGSVVSDGARVAVFVGEGFIASATAEIAVKRKQLPSTQAVIINVILRRWGVASAYWMPVQVYFKSQ